MSDPARVVVAGASGLVGQAVLRASVGRADIRLTAVARREVPLPQGSRLEVFLSNPAQWGEVFAATRPDVLVCTLGTTWKKAGRDEAAFRAVDHDLVLETARQARDAGIDRMVVVSSVGAAPLSRSLYLRTKGEMETALGKLGFCRLDILRPGLLRGPRGADRRPLERLAMLAAPITDRVMQGGLRRARSIAADEVGRAIVALSLRTAHGRFVHDNDAIASAARSLDHVHRAGARR